MGTDFAAWTRGLVDECLDLPSGAQACLVALTGAGRVLVVTGDDPDDLFRYPVDRLALVPSTFGGAIATSRGPDVMRVVCADTDGTFAVVEQRAGVPGWHQRAEPSASDHEILAMLWLLMDVRATRPSPAELAGRLLVWGWLASPARVAGHHGPGNATDAGIDCFEHGDLDGLARLIGVELPARIDAEGLRTLAVALGHPALDWDETPWVTTEDQRLDFLHACLPTRWCIAEELRVIDDRHDLAAMVMAAPSPGA